MNRVRQSVASVEVTTYLGLLDFLNSHASFDCIFGPPSVMLRVSKWAAGTRAIEETEYLATRLAKYFDICQLHLFCSIIEIQFVGTKNYDTHRMMHDIYLALSGLKLVFKHNGKRISLTPDMLYQRLIKFSFLLPANATAWSFSLVYFIL